MRERLIAGLVFLFSAFGPAPAALAQGYGISQELETSIRAEGMGGATTGVTWGEPGVWGNPAALAATRGIAWLEGRTRLLPELTQEIRFDSRRFLFGGAGVGLSIMGDPVSDLGNARLDVGTAYGTDPFGNPTGPWEIGETIEAWGLGVSPIRLWDAVRAIGAPGTPALADRVDIAAGYQHKRTRKVLAPGAVAEADNYDWGVSGRYALLPGDPQGRTTRLEVSAGHAVLSADETSTFEYPGVGSAGPSTSIRRTGVSLRGAIPLGVGSDGGPSMWSWWPGTVPSAVDLGVAWDLEHRSREGDASEDANHWGFEATFMNILTGRLGYVDDPRDGITDMTYGAGVRAPIGPWASLGYDWASVPRATGLQRVDRHGWSAWLYPGAIWESWKSGR